MYFILNEMRLLCSNLKFENYFFRNAHLQQICEVSEDLRKVSEIDSAFLYYISKKIQDYLTKFIIYFEYNKKI